MTTDPYANIAEADSDVVRSIAERMELRAASSEQQAMLQAYLDDVPWPENAHVLEMGCGTGPVARTITSRFNAASVVGLDPSVEFIKIAQELADGLTGLSFQVGDARDSKLGDESFDVVVLHTALCHIPEPERALTEAWRVLNPGGFIAVFDGDYATSTVAIAEHDPLQVCSSAVTQHNVMDRWIIRRLPHMLKDSGFEAVHFRSHGYADVIDPIYMLGHAERGAELLAQQGVIGEPLAEALKQEARRRAAEGRFFGHIAYGSAVARKPDQ